MTQNEILNSIIMTDIRHIVQESLANTR